MKFEKATANVVMFQNEDVVTTSHSHSFPNPPSDVDDKAKQYEVKCTGCDEKYVWKRQNKNADWK